MSVGAILGSVLHSALAATNARSKFKQFQQEFQQLGQDLQSGNLAQAQADFVTLEQNSPFVAQAAEAATNAAIGTASGTAAASGASSPIAQAFQQLARDLQAGNLSAAQQDFSTIQQDFQNAPSQYPGAGGGHHHHPHGFAASQDASSSPFAQLFLQLGQTLQAGNLSNAQKAYSILQQDFRQFVNARSASGSSINASA